VAQVLKESDYRTGAIGKWGLAADGSPGVPQLKGFDEWLGYLDNGHAHNYYPDYLWRYDPPTDATPVSMANCRCRKTPAASKGNTCPTCARRRR